MVKEKNDSTGQRSNLTGGYDPVIETDLARRKNKGMLPRARRGNFYDLPGLLLITYSSLIKPILKGTFSGETSMTVSVTKEDENDYISMFLGVFMIIAII